MRRASFFVSLVLLAGCPSTPGAPGCDGPEDCDGGICELGLCTPRPMDAGRDASCASGGCECARDEDCSSPHPCITALCLDGECELRAYDARCASGEYCDRRFGCTMLVDAGGFDAPPPDAPRPDARIVLRDTGLFHVGEDCVFDRDCGDFAGLPPRCINGIGELSPGAPAPTNGYCSATCEPFVPDQCGDEAYCVQTDLGTGRAWCLVRCVSLADCRADERCVVPTFGGLTAESVCLPATSGP